MVTPKNACSGANALASAGIATIVALVPPDHLRAWNWLLIFLAVIAALTAIGQMILQSREDRDLSSKVTDLWEKHGGKPIAVLTETKVEAPLHKGGITEPGVYMPLCRYGIRRKELGIQPN